jgi:hypothetical protein
MGYAPLGLEIEEATPEVYPCASTPHGQLPASLRARYGLPPAAATFRDVPRRTWWLRDERRDAGSADPALDPTERPASEPIE